MRWHEQKILVLLLTAAAQGSCSAAPPPAGDGRLTVADAYSWPQILVPRISADGKRIAYLRNTADNGVVVELVSTECPSCTDPRRLALPSFVRPRLVHWSADNSALLLEHDNQSGVPTISKVDLATESLTDLFPEKNAFPLFLNAAPESHYRHPIEVFQVPSEDGPKSYAVDFASGQRKPLPRRDDMTVVDVLDQAHQTVLGYTFTDRTTMEWQVARGEETTRVMTVGVQDRLLHSHVASKYVRDGQPRLLLLTSSEGDALALFEFDVLGRRLTPLIQDTADIRSVLLDRQSGKPIAVSTDRGRPEWHALDEIGNHLINRLTRASSAFTDVVDLDSQGRIAVVDEISPTRKPSYGVLNGDNILPLVRGPDRASIVLAEMQSLQISARDGTVLSAYLTEPAVQKCTRATKCPLLVFLHGGPRQRDRYGYSPIHQIFANRGIAVLSVNYRGSRGFGKAFELAGEGQWGQLEQTDVVDSVKALLASGRFDRARVGTAGMSHGGYLALNILRDPEVRTRCAAALSGTANLAVFVEEVVRGIPAMREDLYKSAGDPTTPQGRDDLIKRSPIAEPRKYHGKDLLLIHGSKDRLAPFSDIERFAQVAEDAGAGVTFIEFPREGHQFSEVARQTSIEMLDSFVTQCLRPNMAQPFQSISDAFVFRKMHGHEWKANRERSR